jgi:hypothetical protein
MSSNHLAPACRTRSTELVVEAKGFHQGKMALDSNCQDLGGSRLEKAGKRTDSNPNQHDTDELVGDSSCDFTQF